MQSDVVSGNACEVDVVSAELNGRADVPVNETLVQEEGLGRERVSEDIEVEYVGEKDSRVDLVHLSDKKETSSLEGQMDSVNDEVNNVEKSLNDAWVGTETKKLGMNIVAAEGAIYQNCPVKADLNSLDQQSCPNFVNDDRCGNEMEAEKTVHDSSSGANNGLNEVKTKVATHDKEDSGVHVNEEGFSDHKGVSCVVDLDECVRNDEKTSKKKGGFCASDLVWGKVKSHPWWPAQIFEPGDASDKARKYLKSKGYLVGYFGDQTFAWNAEAKLKPFAPNFSQMVKQTQMEAFQHAVACILHETSRRVEFGLSCRCIAEDVYNQLKIQVVVNAGISEKSRFREGGDRFFTASTFEPVKFIDYVKDLAQGPPADVDRLEHVIAQAQMAAFYRWKGIYHLAEFGLLIGYVNNEADAPVTAEKEKCEVIADETPPPGTMEEDDARLQKRKKLFSDDGHSTKKRKCLSDLLGKKGVRKKHDKESKGKAGSKSIPSSAGRQNKAKSFPKDSMSKEGSPSGTSKDTKPTFRVGESILRVAGQLSQPSPLLKLDMSSHEKAIKDEGNSKQYNKHNPEYASLDVIVSELHLAAIEPLKEHSLLSIMVTFISDFRNSIVPDSELLQRHEEAREKDKVGKPKEGASGSGSAGMSMSEEGCFSGSKSKAKASESEVTATSSLETVEDACCTNKTIKIQEQLTSLGDVKIAVLEPEPEPSEVDGISVVAQSLEMNSMVSSPQQHDGSDNGASVQSNVLEDSATALTLKFTDMDSIPTEEKLKKIFSHFGSLKESETEVLAKKNCARVVFKRRSDAETAFSSSGKFEIFGPSLVCYQLNYAPSPRKSTSAEAKRRKKDETAVEGNAAGCFILE